MTDAEVRIAAIDYFAASGQPAALQAITEALVSDPSEAVRRRAVEVLTGPELASPETLGPVLRLVGSDNVPEPLQELAVASLAQHQAAYPVKTMKTNTIIKHAVTLLAATVLLNLPARAAQNVSKTGRNPESRYQDRSDG